MTKCGHVFCFPCILHYLTLADGNAAGGPSGGVPSQKWRRCPICWDSVYARDLKAVKWWDARAVAKEHESHERESGTTNAANSEDEVVGQLDADVASSEHAPMPHSPALQPQDAPNRSGETLSMRLIERPHLTTLALPQSSTWPTASIEHPLIAPHSAPWHFQPDVMGFAKFMLATPNFLIESLDQDLSELTSEASVLRGYARAGQGSEELGLQFVELAERKVREQIQKVKTELDTPSVASAIGRARNDLKEHEEAQRDSLLAQSTQASSRRQRRRMERERAVEQEQSEGSRSDGRAEAAEGAEEYLALKAQGLSGSSTPLQSSTPSAATLPTEHGPSRGARQRRNLNPPAPSSSSYLFFQAASGQNIYLHPLDIKIMLSHFGSYSAFPRSVAVRVEGADEGSMNDELRRRCKYLSHLPMAADVVFIEVDWDAMGVGKETLRPYDQTLRQRKNKRRDRARREDRAKARAEEADAASRPGGGAAYARRAAEVAASLADDPDLLTSAGMSASYGSSDASGPSAGRASHSPSFRESALFGAERDFPVHPGGGTNEEFPAALGYRLGSSPGDQGHATQAQSGAGRSPGLPAQTNSRPQPRTVWGTPAAQGSFANTLHASSRGGTQSMEDDSGFDDAWHELEEDFILGSTGSGRRPSGAVNMSRGLNRQSTRSWSGANSAMGTHTPGSTGTATPQSESSQTTQGAQAAQGQGKQQKKVKKKLVLTSGGRGR